MKRRTQVVILCEDVEQRSFFEGLCKRLGFVSRVIRVLVAPSGEGAAEQWVRAQYPREVRAYRAKENHVTNGLLAAIDGDARGVISRKTQLDEALIASGLEPRQAGDRIATCVPTWSIETWLAWLCEVMDVDERTPYKLEPSYRRAREAGAISARGAIEGWFAAVRSGEPPSLADGRREILRLQSQADERQA